MKKLIQSEPSVTC